MCVLSEASEDEPFDNMVPPIAEGDNMLDVLGYFCFFTDGLLRRSCTGSDLTLVRK